MKRQQVFVQAADPNGKWGAADILDLEEDSFRAFILQILWDSHAIVGVKPEFVEGEDVPMKCKTPHGE